MCHGFGVPRLCGVDAECCSSGTVGELLCKTSPVRKTARPLPCARPLPRARPVVLVLVGLSCSLADGRGVCNKHLFPFADWYWFLAEEGVVCVALLVVA